MEESKIISSTVEGVLKGILPFLEKYLGRLWVRVRPKEKNPPDKIGIVLAIAAKNRPEQERLEVDFIKPLRQRINSLSSGGDFNVMVLSPEESKKISTHQDALRYLKDVRAHMMIFGDLSIRSKGQEHFIFRWNGAVRHFPIPFEAGTQFSKEFRLLLPESLYFPCAEEIGQFEITSINLTFAIRYVIAVAAAFSLDFPLARKLLEELLNDLESMADVESVQSLVQLRILVRQRLSEVLSAYLTLAIRKFQGSRKKEDILKMNQELHLLKSLDPHNYQAALFRAIFFFFNGEIEKGVIELQNINNSDVSWRYSLGFLYAYEGKIEEALQQYKKTLHHTPILGSFFLDIELFMSDIIAKEPEKSQLLFFRGLINFKHKQDNVLAKQDFENFLLASSGKFPELENLAKNYLAKM